MIPLHASAPVAELRVTELCARCGKELGRERVSMALRHAYVQVHPVCLSPDEEAELRKLGEKIRMAEWMGMQR
jgi:hypothetical protein